MNLHFKIAAYIYNEITNSMEWEPEEINEKINI